MTADFALMTIAPNQINAIDLRDEMERLDGEGIAYECYRLRRIRPDGYQESIGGTVLYVPEAGRTGIEEGAPATWLDSAGDVEQDVRNYLAGDISE